MQIARRLADREALPEVGARGGPAELTRSIVGRARLREVLRRAEAGLEHAARVEAGARVAHVARRAEIRERLLVVLRHAVAEQLRAGG